jgi:hypothetical protein
LAGRQKDGSKILIRLQSMIPKKPAPGHSRPKDGVASLAYDPGVETGFPPEPVLGPAIGRTRVRSPLRRAKEGRKRSCSNKKLEPGCDFIKTDRALGHANDVSFLKTSKER